MTFLLRNFSFRRAGNKGSGSSVGSTADSGLGVDENRRRKRVSDVVGATVNSLCSGSRSGISSIDLGATPSGQSNLVRRRLDLS